MIEAGTILLLPDTFLYYRPSSGGTVEILDIAVSNDHRREGFGRRMVDTLLAKVRGQTHLVWAVTRANNHIAREFYQALGFRVIAVLPQFYEDGNAMMYGLDLAEGVSR